MKYLLKDFISVMKKNSFVIQKPIRDKNDSSIVFCKLDEEISNKYRDSDSLEDKFKYVESKIVNNHLQGLHSFIKTNLSNVRGDLLLVYIYTLELLQNNNSPSYKNDVIIRKIIPVLKSIKGVLGENDTNNHFIEQINMLKEEYKNYG